MNDLDLIKRFREIDSGKVRAEKQEHGLTELKGRIQTDIFIGEYCPDISNETIGMHKKNLEFVELCIDKFEKKILTTEDMKEINFLNKKYKRIA